MANTITNLEGSVLAQMVLQSFASLLLPFTAFAHAFKMKPGEKGDTIKVPFVGAASPAEEFAGTYTIQDSSLTGKKIELDQHKFVSWGLKDLELAENEGLTAQMFAHNKALSLAKAVSLSVMGKILAANYGAPAWTGAFGSFDSDIVIDIDQVCSAADWPEAFRSLILAGPYYSQLLKDGSIKDASQAGGSEGLRQGKVPSIGNFHQILQSQIIPDNGENLAGYAVNPDGLLFGMRYLNPGDGNHDYKVAEPMVEQSTGIILGYREWYSNTAGQLCFVLEALWGSEVGNGNALKRVLSA